MHTTRRRLGTFLLSGLAASQAGRAAAAPASAAAYPTLAKLGALFADRAACARLTDAGLGLVLTEARLAAIESRAATALAGAEHAPRAVLFQLNAEDFRQGRSITVGGYALAETEAGAIVLRSAPAGPV